MPVAPYFFSYLGERILAPSRPPLPHGRSSFQAEFSSSLKFAAGKGAFNRLDVFAEFGINLRRGRQLERIASAKARRKEQVGFRKRPLDQP
jgi:hypothetical protein